MAGSVPVKVAGAIPTTEKLVPFRMSCFPRMFGSELTRRFQKLSLNSGRHKVEVRAEGYEPTEFDVLITPEQTVTFSGTMKKIQQ